MTNQIYADNWWVPLLRGVFSIIFGILAVIFPGAALATLIWFFGAYALVDGVTTIYHAVTHHDEDRAWHLLEGVVSIIAGIAAFVATFLTALTIAIVIGAYAIVTGGVQMVTAWRVRRQIDNEWFLGIAGLLSVLFGVLLFINPFAGAISLAWLIGIYAIAFGGLMIALAFRYRDEGSDAAPTLNNRANA